MKSPDYNSNSMQPISTLKMSASETIAMQEDGEHEQRFRESFPIGFIPVSVRARLQ
jgi:hypothetical protein